MEKKGWVEADNLRKQGYCTRPVVWGPLDRPYS